jgi:hypothetical protein
LWKKASVTIKVGFSSIGLLFSDMFGFSEISFSLSIKRISHVDSRSQERIIPVFLKVSLFQDRFSLRFQLNISNCWSRYCPVVLLATSFSLEKSKTSFGNSRISSASVNKE